MGKKKKNDEEQGPSSEGLFLSLMIILLAFFIMLNSISTLEAERIERAMRSIQATSAGLGLFGHGVGLNKDSRSTGGKNASVIKMERMHEQIRQSLVKWGQGKTWTESYEDERRLIIRMSEVAMFTTGSNTMHPRVFPFLDELGKMVKQVGIPVTVQGHSDGTGSDTGSANWILSAKRAIEVARYLTAKGGANVPDYLVEAEAFGETRPIASNDTEEGRNKNRRVDLVFYKKDIAKIGIQE